MVDVAAALITAMVINRTFRVDRRVHVHDLHVHGMHMVTLHMHVGCAREALRAFERRRYDARELGGQEQGDQRINQAGYSPQTSHKRAFGHSCRQIRVKFAEIKRTRQWSSGEWAAASSAAELGR